MYQLDEHEAFHAMSLFLRQFADRAGDDMLTLLSDISLDADGKTFDPAAWDDWMRSVASAKASQTPA